MGLTPNEFEKSMGGSPLGSREPLPLSLPGDNAADAQKRSAQRVDSLLNVMVQRERTPARLAWRTFAASVKHLPGRRSQNSGWRRMVRSRLHTSVWGQMAMAASVALTFAAASWFLVLPTSSPDPGYVQYNEAQRDVLIQPVYHVEAVPHKWWLEASDLAYLEEAWETDLSEVAGDFEMIREDLGL